MYFSNASFEAAFGLAGQLPEPTLPEICVAGRSNVGKSSLINTLCGRKNLARVSGTPGKTSTVNFFRVGDIRIVDLPGYGFAKVSETEKQRWSELLEGYFTQKRNRPLAVQLIDIRRGPGELDFMMMDMFESAGIQFTAVLTKSDKLNKTEYRARSEAAEKELRGYPGLNSIIPFSSLNGDGVERLRNEIIKAIS